MYDLNELEKKWVAYKRQKYKKIGSLAAAFVGVGIISFASAYAIFGHNGQAVTSEAAGALTQNNTTKQPETNQTMQPMGAASNVPYQYQMPQKEIVIISPEEKKEEFKTFQPTEQNQQLQTASSGAQATNNQQAQQRTATVKPSTPPKIFMETKVVDQVDMLAARYSKDPSASTAASLSEAFYKQGNYQKALKWAINANNLDPKNERSWIMFAKSSYKLGKKQDAINALENFSNTANSEAVKTTLTQIKNNEL